MASYNFKKEALVYLVDDIGETTLSQFQLDISEISFSQTFTDRTYSKKTLQNQAMFEGSSTVRANKATFSFTFPAIREDDLKIVFDRLLDYQSFDLYISTKQDVFKLRNCVITNGDFIIERLKPLSMAISGEASQLSKEGVAGDGTDAYQIPGTLQPRDNNRTYNRVNRININLGDTFTGVEEISSDLASMSIELQNKVKWLPFSIVGGCEGDANILYPEEYVVESRILAGSINRYLTDTNNTNLLNYNTDIPLYIEVGQNNEVDTAYSVYGFVLDMDNCSFTNRLQTGNVFTQSYDWRLTQKVTALSDIVTYVTL